MRKNRQPGLEHSCPKLIGIEGGTANRQMGVKDNRSVDLKGQPVCRPKKDNRSVDLFERVNANPLVFVGDRSAPRRCVAVSPSRPQLSPSRSAVASVSASNAAVS